MRGIPNQVQFHFWERRRKWNREDSRKILPARDIHLERLSWNKGEKDAFIARIGNGARLQGELVDPSNETANGVPIIRISVAVVIYPVRAEWISVWAFDHPRIYVWVVVITVQPGVGTFI